MDDATRKCTKCKLVKPICEFRPRKTSGWESWCKQCNRDIYRTRVNENPKYKREVHLKSYGMTLGDYDNLVENQNGRCKICNKHESEARKKRLCIDHKHGTKIVRGLLCDDCNVGLGNFKDNIWLLSKAIEYLNGRL